ncbi:Lsr2 family DNA-binding protein [Microbacterium rhizophilus]|uniref:Lsr2 family DNA-binding protein n=1 Tax=Microbacterium rhizophilus TaxID=3138934 RepID=UPI0031EFD2C5
MSSADLFEDGFPHGTPDGYDRGCRGSGCPGQLEWGLSCARAWIASKGDYRYNKLARQGLTPAEIAAELDGRFYPAKTPTPTEEHTMTTKPAPKPAPPKVKAPAPTPVPDIAAAKADPIETAAANLVELGKAHTATSKPAEPETPTAPTQPAELTAAEKRERNAQIRTWAREKGYTVGLKGPLPVEVIEHYDETHRAAEPTPEEAVAAVRGTLLGREAAASIALDKDPKAETIVIDGPVTVGPVAAAVEQEAPAVGELDDKTRICSACLAGDHGNHNPRLGGICIGCACEQIPEPARTCDRCGGPADTLSSDDLCDGCVEEIVQFVGDAAASAAQAVRPAWGDVAEAVDVERARTTAVLLEQELARAEQERDTALAEVATLKTAFETTLERWDRQRLDLEHQRRTHTHDVGHIDDLRNTVAHQQGTIDMLSRALEAKTSQNTRLSNELNQRAERPGRRRVSWRNS